MRPGFGVVVASLAVLAGCSGGEPATPTYPVDGRVEFRGQAASGAFVVFHPTNGGSEAIRPTGKVGEDGRFRLTTRDEHDGAPAGDYAVTVEWYKLVQPKGSEWQRGPNVIPTRYSQAGTTPLRVTIRAGSNSLEPFSIAR